MEKGFLLQRVEEGMNIHGNMEEGMNIDGNMEEEINIHGKLLQVAWP